MCRHRHAQLTHLLRRNDIFVRNRRFRCCARRYVAISQSKLWHSPSATHTTLLHETKTRVNGGGKLDPCHGCKCYFGLSPCTGSWSRIEPERSIINDEPLRFASAVCLCGLHWMKYCCCTHLPRPRLTRGCGVVVPKETRNGSICASRCQSRVTAGGGGPRKRRVIPVQSRIQPRVGLFSLLRWRTTPAPAKSGTWETSAMEFGTGTGRRFLPRETSIWERWERDACF